MHLPQFLKQIDTISSRMSRDQLERLLHEIARTIPEKERGRLLSLFTAFDVKDPDSSRGGTSEGVEGHSFDDEKKVTVQNPLLTLGRSEHSRQKLRSMPHRH